MASEGLRLVGLGLVLAGLMTWWTAVTAGGAHGLNRFRVHPERHEGEPIVLSLVIVGEANPDGYVAWSGDIPWPVHADTQPPPQGAVVSIGGTFQHQAVEQAWVEPHPRRAGKWRLALLGLALWALTLPLWLRWDGRGRVRG